jgi:hypothetical protein
MQAIRIAALLGAVGMAAGLTACGTPDPYGANNIANRNANPYNTAGPVYRVWVQTDSGVMRTYDVSTVGDLRPGDRVRIENGVIYMG